MTSLAKEIKGLMDLGYSLERATELAVGDRKQENVHLSGWSIIDI